MSPNLTWEVMSELSQNMRMWFRWSGMCFLTLGELPKELLTDSICFVLTSERHYQIKSQQVRFAPQLSFQNLVGEVWAKWHRKKCPHIKISDRRLYYLAGMLRLCQCIDWIKNRKNIYMYSLNIDKVRNEIITLVQFAPILGENGTLCVNVPQSLIWLTNPRLVQIIVHMNNHGSTKIRHSLLSGHWTVIKTSPMDYLRMRKCHFVPFKSRHYVWI